MTRTRVNNTKQTFLAFDSKKHCGIINELKKR